MRLDNLWCEIFGFLSAHSLQTGEKYISFAQLVLLSFFDESVFTFQFLNDKIALHCIASTKNKYIKLNTKTQIFFSNIRLLYTL